MAIPTNPVSVGNATKKSDYDALYNGTVLADTGGTAGGAQSIPGVKTFEALAVVNLTSGRTAFQELTSGVLAATGWYTIAEMDDAGNCSASADFAIAITSARNTIKFKAQIGQSTSKKTHINTDIEIVGINDISGLFSGVRIAKSDSVSAGAKLQINLSSGKIYYVQMSNNIGRYLGWELVTPYLDNTPTLPDGTTVGTFLIAGEELSLSASSQFLPMWGYVIDDNSIRVTFLWNGIPYQGTTLTITDPSTSWTYYLGGGSTAGITSLTVSSLLINQQEKLVSATLTKTGQWTGKAGLPIIIRAVGTGGKLTLS